MEKKIEYEFAILKNGVTQFVESIDDISDDDDVAAVKIVYNNDKLSSRDEVVPEGAWGKGYMSIEKLIELRENV